MRNTFDIFDVHYLDHELTQGKDIFISDVNVFTDSTPFITLITFCKVQSLLIGNKYDLKPEQEKNLIKDYYYSCEKDLTADLQAIKNYLTY